MGILCDMQLDNPKPVYQPGDVLSGHINLTFDERILIKAVAIKISGYAFTRWEKPTKEKKQNKNKPNSDTEASKLIYTNREDYLSTIHYFIGSDVASEKIVDAGSYHYNFGVTLPLSCPSVFESKNGHIRYELDVFIEYPTHRHSCYMHNIHVRRPYDLRTIPGINQPLDIAIVEKKPLVKFWQRPLQLSVNLQQTGFIPRDIISIHVKISNYDLLNLTEIIYKFNLVATYTGFLKNKAKMHIARNNLVTTVHSLFGQNGNVVQHLQNIHVPETSPTLTVGDCRCIQISYEIEIFVNSTQKKRHISTVIPVVIGTISHSQVYPNLPREITASAPVLTAARSMDNLLSTQLQENATFADATAPSLEPSTPLQRDPKTSFREADFMTSSTLNKKKKQNKSVENLDDFKPKYLYYDMPTIEQQTIAQTTNQRTSNIEVVNNEKTRF